jgi:hypothetical protein
MPSTLLAAALAISLHSFSGSAPVAGSPVVNLTTNFPADTTIKSPSKNKMYTKGKGTMGFVSGLLLGPVGLGGVFLFSHNRAQRKAAKKGCAIFGAVVVTAALCWLLFLGVKDLGNFGSGGSNHSGSGGSGSSGGSGRSGGSVGAGRPGSGHSGSTGGWLGNINFPDIGPPSPSTKKKATAPEPSVNLPPRILWKY